MLFTVFNLINCTRNHKCYFVMLLLHVLAPVGHTWGSHNM